MLRPTGCSPKRRNGGSSWSPWLGCGDRTDLVRTRRTAGRCFAGPDRLSAVSSPLRAVCGEAAAPRRTGVSSACRRMPALPPTRMPPSSSTSAPTTSSAPRSARSSAVRWGLAEGVRRARPLRGARHGSRPCHRGDRRGSGTGERRGPGPGHRPRRGPGRSHPARRRAGAGPQRRRCRGRPGPDRHMGPRHDGPGRRLRLQLGPQWQVEQAFPVRLERPRPVNPAVRKRNPDSCPQVGTGRPFRSCRTRRGGAARGPPRRPRGGPAVSGRGGRSRPWRVRGRARW